MIARIVSEADPDVRALPAERVRQYLAVEDPTFWTNDGIDLKTPGAGQTTTTQGLGAVAALERLAWPADMPLDQAEITTGCALDYIRVTAPELMPDGRYPKLDALWRRLAARPEFQATSFREYNVPRGK